MFALSEGGIYGWFTPLKDFSDRRARRVARDALGLDHPDRLRGRDRVSSSRFYFVERAKERRDGDPLFEFAHLRFKTYRYGLLTGLVLAMGQLGISFVLPVFLQDGRHLSPWHNGLWLLPTGLFVIVGAQLGGRLIRRFGTIQVVRAGLVLYELGLLADAARDLAAHHRVASCCPGSRSTASGIGFAGAQLTNVVLSEIPAESSGVASGANTTVRQVGSALGVAVIGSVLTVQTVSHAVQRIKAAALPAAVKAQAIAGVHARGSGYAPPERRRPRGRRRRAHRGRARRRARHARRARCSRSSSSRSARCCRSSSRTPRPFRRDEPRHGADGFEPLEPLDPDPALLH